MINPLWCFALIPVLFKSKRAKTGKHVRRPIESEELEWREDEITDATIAAWAKGIRDTRVLTILVLRDVYPTTTEGQHIDWPIIEADCASIRMLQHRTHIRVDRLRAQFVDEQVNECH